MSGVLSKKLFTNSKYIAQFTHSYNNALKTTLNLNRFLRKGVTKEHNLVKRRDEFQTSSRSYNKLFTRQNQTNSTIKPNEPPPVAETAQLSVFKRFKDAYRQHGKVIIFIHIGNCMLWITGLYILAKRFAFSH